MCNSLSSEEPKFLESDPNLILPLVLPVTLLSPEHGDKYTPHIVEYSADQHLQNTVAL